MVEDVHRSYAAVGADVVETNTFGANRLVLSEFDEEAAAWAADLNREAARIARALYRKIVCDHADLIASAAPHASGAGMVRGDTTRGKMTAQELREREAGRFLRQRSSCRNWVTPDGSPGPTGEGGFEAEHGAQRDETFR